MKIQIETIPHDQQRYPTVGDWQWLDQHTLIIRVSELTDWRREALVAIHELVEVLLCKERKISEQAVDDFDKKYERKRKAGLKAYQGEPGDHKFAPYRKEHFFATNIEALLAGELGVDWPDYEREVESLP